MKTFSVKSKLITRSWYIINAEGKILGRMATKLAEILRGKHKIEYTPHVDIGDYVIVINAEKIIVTGNKLNQKKYFYHTNYSGGLKQITFKEMSMKNPQKIISIAVKGMLPKGNLGNKMYRKLKIFVGNKHCHNAQQPKELKF